MPSITAGSSPPICARWVARCPRFTGRPRTTRAERKRRRATGRSGPRGSFDVDLLDPRRAARAYAQSHSEVAHGRRRRPLGHEVLLHAEDVAPAASPALECDFVRIECRRPLERQSLGDVERPLTPQHDPDRRVSGELEARSRRVPGAAELVRETEILAAQQIPRVDGHDLDEDRGAGGRPHLLAQRPAHEEQQLHAYPSGGQLEAGHVSPSIRATTARRHRSMAHAVPSSTIPPSTNRVPVSARPPIRSRNRVTMPRPNARTPVFTKSRCRDKAPYTTNQSAKRNHSTQAAADTSTVPTANRAEVPNSKTLTGGPRGITSTAISSATTHAVTSRTSRSESRARSQGTSGASRFHPRTTPADPSTKAPKGSTSEPVATVSARSAKRRKKPRSEERRVGKECRSRWSADH